MKPRQAKVHRKTRETEITVSLRLDGTGATKIETPHLDRLAREGMRFTDAHSAASVCTPTRYGVITGRYPSRIGQFGVLTTYSKPIIPKARKKASKSV